MSNFFSKKNYFVIIGTENNNNIEFYANEEDLNLIKKLERTIYEIRNNYNSKLDTPIKVNVSYLDEIKKLGALLHNGFITQQEFDIKKQELLKK